jgi:hypothetical protein
MMEAHDAPMMEQQFDETGVTTEDAATVRR